MNDEKYGPKLEIPWSFVTHVKILAASAEEGKNAIKFQPRSMKHATLIYFLSIFQLSKSNISTFFILRID